MVFVKKNFGFDFGEDEETNIQLNQQLQNLRGSNEEKQFEQALEEEKDKNQNQNTGYPKTLYNDAGESTTVNDPQGEQAARQSGYNLDAPPAPQNTGYPKTLWKAFGDSTTVNSPEEEQWAKRAGYNKTSEPADPGSGSGGGYPLTLYNAQGNSITVNNDQEKQNAQQGGFTLTTKPKSGGGGGSSPYPLTLYNAQGDETVVNDPQGEQAARMSGFNLTTKPTPAPVQKQKLLFKRDPDGTLQTITVPYTEGDDTPWQTLVSQGWAEQDPGVAQAPFEPAKYNQGGTWYEISNYPGVSGKAYAVEYTLDSGRKIYYLASKSELTSMFGENKLPPSPTVVDWSTFSGDTERYFGGAAAEVIGTDDNFSTLVTRTIQSGGTAELPLPDFIQDDEDLLDIFFLAVVENKSQSWLLKEMAKQQTFLDEFPGIDELFKITNDWETALNDWNTIAVQIRRLNTRYNETVDVNDLVEASIKKGYTVEDIQSTYDIFEKAQQNSAFLTAFQAIIDQDPDVSFTITDAQGIVDFFEGKAPTEVYDLYEAASIQEQGTKFELGIDAQGAIDMALATPGQVSQENISASLQQAAIQIARVRDDLNLGRYNLSEQAIINAALGLKTPGITEIEIQDAFQRIFSENKALQENPPLELRNNSAVFTGQRDIRSI
jgi:hypothetical protein